MWPLAAFYFTVFLWSGLINAFVGPWLKYKGLSIPELSVLMAAGVLVKLAVDPVVATVCDAGFSRRKMLVLLLCGMSGAFSILYLVESAFLVVPVYLAALACWATVLPLGDSLAASRIRTHAISYPKVRTFGAIAVAVGVLGGGSVLSTFGQDSLMPMFVASCIACLLAVLQLDDVRAPSSGRIPMLSLLKRPRFRRAIASVGLVLGSHSVFYAVGTISMLAAGFSSRELSVVWAVAMASEALVFIVLGARALDGIGWHWLVMVGAVAGVVRWIGWATTPSFPEAICLQLLQGATLAAVNVGLMRFVVGYVSEAERVSAFSCAAIVSHAIAPAGAMMAAGALFSSSGHLAYLLPAMMCGLAGLVLLQHLRNPSDTPSELMTGPGRVQ